MIKTYTYKIYNNPKILKRYEKQLGICRYVYNLAKQTKEDSYKAGVSLSNYDLQKQLTECKKENKWLYSVGADSLLATLDRLDNGYKKFYRDLKKGQKVSSPKWAKKDKYNTLEFKRVTSQTEKGFNLPKFGIVKVFNFKKIKGNVKTARITKKAGELYLQVVVEESDIVNTNKNHVGIDMGLTYFLTTSNGEFVDNPKHLDKYLVKLRIENRKLARVKKGSTNFRKQVLNLQRTHLKVSNTRKDFLHKTSAILAKENGVVYREDLSVSKMMVNKQYSKQIADVAWGTFFNYLEYKTKVIKVNPAYTSQLCNKCNSVNKENRKTQSEFKCISCGHETNADLNAASNIKKLGHQLLYANVSQ